MEFPLPYFALKKRPQPNPSQNKEPLHSIRKRTDISLIDGESSVPGSQEVYQLHEAQVSFVLYGHGEYQWTACAFVDNAYESGDLYHAEEPHDGDGEADGFDEDPIATGLHISKPIWRPRQYYSKALEVNIKEVSRVWHELIHKMECDIIAHV